jgi:hypothetical protein
MKLTKGLTRDDALPFKERRADKEIPRRQRIRGPTMAQALSLSGALSPHTVSSKHNRSEWLKRRVRLSFLAALTGWAAFMLVCLALCLIDLLSRSAVGTNPWIALLWVGMGSGLVVLALWLVVLVPLFLVPNDSFLWKPGILTLLGVVTGPIIVCMGAIYSLKSNPTIRIYDPAVYLMGGVVFPGLPSAIIGGVTGMMAARLHRRLVQKEINPE